MRHEDLKALARAVAGLAGLAILAFAVWAGETVVKERKTDGRVTVIYWEKWTGDEGKALRRVVDKFNAEQDKIFVKVLTISNVNDKTLLATSGGNPPDIAGLWDNNIAQFADAQAAMDLTEMCREAGIGPEDYIKPYWDTCEHRGKVIALPSTPASTALHVNRALVPEKYRDPANFPKTIEEFDALMESISKTRPDGSIEVAGFLPSEPGWWPWLFGYFFGGELFEDGEITLDAPRNIEGYEWVQKWAKLYGPGNVQTFQSGFGNFSSPQNAWLEGKVAVVLQGVWMANFVQLYNPELDWYAVPFPYPADRPELAGTTMCGLDVLMIPRGAKHPKEAFEFIKFVQRQDVMEMLCSDHGKNSPLSVVSEEFFNNHKNPYIRLFDQLARSPNAVITPKTGVWNEVSAEITNAFQEINLQSRTPAEALRRTQTRMKPTYIDHEAKVAAREESAE